MYIADMSKIYLHVVIDVRPGKVEEFATLLKAHVGKIRTENGCELIEIFRDENKPAVINVWEIWTDRQAWDFHMNAATSKQWQGTAAEYVFGEKISLHQAL